MTDHHDHKEHHHRHPNTALIINHAKKTITIDRDPNFDDMVLIFNGKESKSPYALAPKHHVYVGSTYVSDMGLALTYDSDERFMEVGVGTPAGLSPLFQIISDSEEGDEKSKLTFTVADQTEEFIKLTFHERSK